LIFGEVVYTGFVTITAIIYWLIPRNLRVLCIAIFGMIFYGYYAGWWVLLLMLLCGMSWLVLFRTKEDTLAINQGVGLSQKPLLSPASFIILLSLFTLSFFKYGNFISELFMGQKSKGLAAPLAISFFIFEFIHIAAEKLKGNLSNVSISEYFAFIFFFPTMIAGPIKRFDQFSMSLQKAEFKYINLVEGVFRIIIGVVKKVLIADNINTLIQEIGTPEKTQNLLLLNAAVILYGIRIYLDFSGYSDIAIGSAKLFGLNVPENFNFPYSQTNINEFWRHWHISLYNWLVDYVYIPLGGSRVVFPRLLLNIIITMFISGVWHGAAWNFIAWGIWHGILLCVHKVYSDIFKPLISLKFTQSLVYSILSYILTMTFIFLGWSLFMWKIPDVIQYYSLMWKSVT
jgi:alginate O-acetyltransferase complex protein AlgI